MDGEAFRLGAHLGSSHPSAAMEDPIQTQNQSQFLFNAKSAPLQLRLFGSPAGKMDNASAYSSLSDFSRVKPCLFTSGFNSGGYEPFIY